ncbi:hypothetical protein BSLG_003678 [Batrachochytrium salamandrivorans]|nr:hypothetical protein BSLG_003678 [Batrachochytrium salamandrivorans]
MFSTDPFSSISTFITPAVAPSALTMTPSATYPQLGAESDHSEEEPLLMDLSSHENMDIAVDDPIHHHMHLQHSRKNIDVDTPGDSDTSDSDSDAGIANSTKMILKRRLPLAASLAAGGSGLESELSLLLRSGQSGSGLSRSGSRLPLPPPPPPPPQPLRKTRRRPPTIKSSLSFTDVAAKLYNTGTEGQTTGTTANGGNMSLGSGGGRRRSTGASAASLTAAATARQHRPHSERSPNSSRMGSPVSWKHAAVHRPVTVVQRSQVDSTVHHH